MTFLEALEHLLQGQKIRSRCWCATYISKGEDGTILMDGNECVWLWITLALFDDWVIYDLP